ncbi:uncharacterized protein LOC141693048 isoform X2 [Apium graveolens]|uniref:uncharacterized protein LOC141693048 isoform X2 n=1 Tax=Apium graveolens TaxID=4045 RepID=UPI003D7B10BF
MLIRSSLSSSTEAAISLKSDNGEKELIRDWTAGGGSLQKSTGCKHTIIGHKRSIQDMEREGNCTCLLNHMSSSSQHSTVGTMSGTSLITFVYKRRRLRDSSSSVLDQASNKEKPSRSFFSEISCEFAKEHENSIAEVETETHRAPAMLPTECNKELLLLKSTPEGCSSQAEELGLIENSQRDELKIVEACHVNDSYSSSQLKTDLCATTSEPKLDYTGDCSSADALVMDGLQVCDQSEMLICDQCEEAFHTSCCNPPVKNIPRTQRFCHSCLKKRSEALKEISREPVKKKSVASRNRNATSKCASSFISRLLDENKPYTSNVRVGPEFQAEIPDYCGPVANEIVNIGKPLEIHPSVGASSQEGNLRKNIHISICNWLQCRQVMYGLNVAGAVCGKWRRAPLYERQTNTWECSDSILWDPSHADCAVPQELSTKQIQKDLKYINKLKPQLAAMKHKVGRIKGSDRKGKRPAKRVRKAGAL